MSFSVTVIVSVLDPSELVLFSVLVSGSASIVDVEYVKEEKYHSKQVMRERLGKVIYLSEDKKVGVFQSPTRGLVEYNSEKDEMGPVDLDDPRIGHTTLFPEPLIHTVFGDSYLLMCLNIADFRSVADSHKRTSDEFWKIREDYKSLIIDYDSLSESERISRRDILLQRIGAVYSNAPPTGSIACFFAKRALDKGEQEITPRERDDFLRSC